MSDKICPLMSYQMKETFTGLSDRTICQKEQCQWWVVLSKETIQPDEDSNALVEPIENYIMGCVIEKLGG